MAEQGAGALHAAFQRLKERLAAEGIFDEARKRPLEQFVATRARRLEAEQ